MRGPTLDLGGEVEEGLGDGELGFDLLDAEAVVNEREEAGTLGGVHQLSCDFLFSLFKVWEGGAKVFKAVSGLYYSIGAL